MTHIFVAGVTGCQGRAVVHHALKKGWTIHGLTRNPASEAASALTAQGVQLTQGDYDDTAALETAMKGCMAVFFALVPNFADPSAEERWAVSIVAVAKATSIQAVVVSTGLGSGNPEQLTGWEEGSLIAQVMRSKQRVEAVVTSAGITNWTVLRPGFFMANFLVPKVTMYQGFRETGVWTTALLETTRLPLVDDLDIGAFAVEALARPNEFRGKTVAIGFDVRTPGQILQVLSAATGRKLKAKFLEGDELDKAKAANPVISSYLLMRDMVSLVDIDEVKSFGIPMGTFEEYVQRRIDDAKVTFENVAPKEEQ
ncbi:hypothetical protein SCUCBS95973_001565 [Sporothrix curviconia]|uniref:NmrA-like domain-containing protein n=1 Tax=Sporothrix curviconia TaxID=1260050 RepID=A0ABP0AZS6_9PEZI